MWQACEIVETCLGGQGRRVSAWLEHCSPVLETPASPGLCSPKWGKLSLPGQSSLLELRCGGRVHVP